jgi:HD-GYP domain-containing protein (c-di-GMP phosphodiesterase class II)
MTTDRPHQRPLTEPAAVAELRRCAGGQLDPACVEALLHVLAGAGVAAERAAA